MKKLFILPFLAVFYLPTPFTFTPISLVASVKATASPSSSIDTSTATAIIVAIADSGSGGTTAAPTDNKSNTYTAINSAGYSGGATGIFLQMFSCNQPCTVGSGHTFSAAGWDWIALAYTGTATSSVVEQETGSAGCCTLTTTVATGSITPAANNAVVVSCGVSFLDDEISVNSGLTIQQNQAQAGGRAIACADIVQTTAGAVNATWTSGASTSVNGAMIINLKAAASSPSFPAGILFNVPIKGGGIIK